MSKFIISLTGGGLYKFNLYSNNGEIVLFSESYTTKAACLNAVGAVKQNASQDNSYEKGNNLKGYYFYFKARNGEILAKSNIYVSQSSRDAAINLIKQIAPISTIQA